MSCIKDVLSFALQTKCERYWPDSPSVSQLYGEITVLVTARERRCDYTMRTFKVTKNVGDIFFTMIPN